MINLDRLVKGKSNLVLILLIVGIVFINGCISFKQPTTSQQPVTPQPPAPQVAPQPSQQAPTGKPVITRDVELEVCAGMPQVGEIPLEAFCMIGLAAKYKDVSMCNKFISDVRKSCYAIIAQVSKNPAMCDEAGSYKDACYEEYARTTKDPAACDKITDIYQKDNCYSNAASTLADGSYCEKIKVVTNKDNCYLNIAMRLQDKTYCDKIAGAQKEDCLRNLQQAYPVKRVY